MARRPPLVSVGLIVLVVIFLFTTRKYTQHSNTLDRIEKYEPEADPDVMPYKANAHGGHSMEMSHDMNHEMSSEMSSEMNHAEMNHAEMNHAEMADHMGDKHSQDAENSKIENSVEEKNVHKTETEISKNVDEDIPNMEELAKGRPIMSKMPNQTTRAILGNAGWRLLHTILAQYPEEPTEEEQETLKTFLKFFSRVYPCRECAEHFQELLAQFPPQLGSRKIAAMWGCDAHNKVNKRLGKPIFDCSKIFDEYDCGCGDEASVSASAIASTTTSTAASIS